MTAPNGPGGVNPDAKFVNSATGLGELDQLTRPNVTALLKEMHFPPTNIWRNPAGVLKTAWNAMTSAISGAATNAVNALTQIGTLIWKVGGEIIDDVGDFITAALANANTALTNAGNALGQIGSLIGRVGGSIIDDVGDFINAALSNAATALTNSGISIANVQAGFKAFFDTWFGRDDGDGSTAQLTYTIEAIKDAVINGFTVVTFVVDTVAYPVAPAAERHSVLIGGGQSAVGTTAGLHGSFVTAPIDLTGVEAIDVQIGTAGNRTYIRVAADPPHTGQIIAQSPPHGSPGGVAGTFAYTSTTSLPGSGGNGGIAGTSPAFPGESSAAAAGGAAGSGGVFGTSGQPGGSVSAGAQTKCGGGGGGGGGAANTIGQASGHGGAGGYPGGAGGGRGSVTTGGNPGNPGPGAPGVAWLFFR